MKDCSNLSLLQELAFSWADKVRWAKVCIQVLERLRAQILAKQLQGRYRMRHFSLFLKSPRLSRGFSTKHEKVNLHQRIRNQNLQKTQVFSFYLLLIDASDVFISHVPENSFPFALVRAMPNSFLYAWAMPIL